MNAVVKAEAPQFTPALYDRMTKAIAQCARIDEAKELHDQAMALEVYARQARNFETERMCAEIRVRAERKGGELLKVMERNPVSQGGDQKSAFRRENPIPQSEYAQAKEQAGLSEATAHRWQKLADVPADQFEQHATDPARKPTTTRILKDTDPDRNAKPKRKVADVVYMATRINPWCRSAFSYESVPVLSQNRP